MGFYGLYRESQRPVLQAAAVFGGAGKPGYIFQGNKGPKIKQKNI